MLNTAHRFYASFIACYLDGWFKTGDIGMLEFRR